MKEKMRTPSLGETSGSKPVVQSPGIADYVRSIFSGSNAGPAALTTWLTVGGCPRSGTTALGDLLNKSRQVALLHEYDAAKLFRIVDGLFEEEQRLSAFAASDAKFEKFMPAVSVNQRVRLSKARDERRLISAIFEVASGKPATICGTKMPGYHLWPAASLPAGVSAKTIHITRHPHAVIFSYVQKMIAEGYSENLEFIFDTALAHWISSWNFMIDSLAIDDFLPVFYEAIAEAPANAAAEIAAFLGVDVDFDMRGFAPQVGVPPLEGLRALGLDRYLPKLEAVALGTDWLTFARAAVRDRAYFGFPLDFDGDIDLGEKGNGWKHVHRGFHSAESRGSWINGADARLFFSPATDYSGPVLLAFSVPRTFEGGGDSQNVTVEFDGRHVANLSIALGDNNGGTGASFSFVLPDVRFVRGKAIMVRFIAAFSQSRLGLVNDNRDLSVMIERVRIVPISL